MSERPAVLIVDDSTDILEIVGALLRTHCRTKTASNGEDALQWISSRPWSNGKVGTTGCSSTAEYQMAIAAKGHPAYAAMNVQGFGAGVGRVKPYYEQGNWYRGGAVQMLFIDWLYGEQNQVRPMMPKNATKPRSSSPPQPTTMLSPSASSM